MPLNSPIITGDVSGGLHSTSVDKLKGNAVAATAPTSGQVLTWDGSQWAPAASTGGGGGGANGLTYYFNQGTNADAPTTNLPNTPKQLGRSADAAQTTATTGTLTVDTWTAFAGFVTESTPQDPGASDIPAGLWDFNLWVYGVQDPNHDNSVRAKVFKYDGANAPTLLATSAAVAITETSSLVAISVLVPETTMLVTDRIFVTLEAFATGNGHSVTAQFGDGTPSHVHTSLGLVAGTGLWKNVAGTLQSPASLLVDADVASDAAIAQSKINGLTTSLAGKAAQTQIDIYSTPGTFVWTKPAGAKLVEVLCIAGGSGGGSGRRGASGTNIYGGGAGGGGGWTYRTISADILAANESVVVAASVAGGAARTANDTDGALGGIGNPSSFGSLIFAASSLRGGAGTATNGTGGSTTSQRAMIVGGAGGASGVAAAAGGGANSQSGGGGGGGGGGISSAPISYSGGAGGIALSTYLTGGQSIGGVAPGGNGAVGFGTTALYPFAGGGGSGGGAGNASTAGGNGGDGAIYGGGGGGGGGYINGFNSGAGGSGAQGIVIVTTYF